MKSDAMRGLFAVALLSFAIAHGAGQAPRKTRGGLAESAAPALFCNHAWLDFLALAAAGSFAFALHRCRLDRIAELERIRMQIAADLHDDIGASLSQIAILSEVAGSHRGSKQDLDRIAEIARESVDSMGDIVWAINPRPDAVQDLTRRMRTYAS
jgi:signal transduction histidine kinase